LYPLAEGCFAPRNKRYIAAWSRQVKREPMERWILNSPVYGTSNGAAGALAGNLSAPRAPLVDTDYTAFHGSSRRSSITRPTTSEHTLSSCLPHTHDPDYALPRVVRLGRNAMTATGEVIFYTQEGGVESPYPFRMTHVLVRENRRWTTATHHASLRPINHY
jgi:hypothetical protein